MSAPLKSNFAIKTRFEPFYVSGRIEVSADGERLFTSTGNAVKIFNVSLGQVEGFLTTDESDQISVFVLNPVTQTLVTASKNLLVREWDWKNTTVVRTWKAVHHAAISCMAFDPTGAMIATGSGDSTVKIWNMAQKCHTHSFRGSQGVISVAKFHPTASVARLYSAADDCRIRVWSLNPSKEIAVLEGHYSVVTDFVFHGDQYLISSSRDKVLVVWDIQAFTQVRTVPIFEEVDRIVLLPNQPFPELSVVPGDINVLTGGTRGILSVWNLTKNKNTFQRPVTPAGTQTEHSTITQIVFLPQLRRLFVVLMDQSILVYDLPELKPKKQLSGYNDEIFDVKFIDQSKRAIIATNSPRLKVYDLTTSDCHFVEGHTDSVLCVAVMKNRNWVFTSGKDCNICTWEYKSDEMTLRPLAVTYGHTAAVGTLATSRTNKKSFIISGSEDSTVKLWNIHETKSDGGESDLALLSTHTEVAHGKGVNAVAVSPDDKWAATAGGDKTAKIWKIEPFTVAGVLRGHKRAVWSVQFAPHDKVIGTSSGDGTVKLWALSDFRCLKTFEGHDCSVMKFFFLSNGLQILSAGSDGIMRLWDVRKNICQKSFDEHEDKVWAIDVSEDEQNFLSGGADSTFLLWKDVSEEEQQEQRNKKDELIIQEQELANLLQSKEFSRAFMLALRLEQPHRLLNIITEILAKEDGSETLKRLSEKLEDFQLEQLMGYIAIWNTNSKHTIPAQMTLQTVFKTVPPKRLLGLPKIRSHVEGLLPYSERHSARIDQLLVHSMFFDYMWNSVKLQDGDGLDLS